jgi:hypothetical protein
VEPYYELDLGIDTEKYQISKLHYEEKYGVRRGLGFVSVKW